MADSKIILLSDLHITESNLNTIKRLFDMILDRVDTCAGVIHLGDLFHQKDRIPNVLHKTVIDFVKELEERDKFFYTLFGNHDGYFSELASGLYLNEFGDKVRLITKPEEIIIGNYKWLFIPYHEDSKLDEVVSIIRYSNADILCLHNDINGLAYDINVRAKSKITIDMVSKFKWVFCGHIHRPQKVKNIYVLGSPFARSFADKSYYNLKIERGIYEFTGKLVRFYKFKHPYYVKLELDITNVDEVVSKFNKNYEGEDVHLWIDLKDDAVVVDDLRFTANILSQIVTRSIKEEELDKQHIYQVIPLEQVLESIVSLESNKVALLKAAFEILEQVGVRFSDAEN